MDGFGGREIKPEINNKLINKLSASNKRDFKLANQSIWPYLIESETEDIQFWLIKLKPGQIVID